MVIGDMKAIRCNTTCKYPLGLTDPEKPRLFFIHNLGLKYKVNPTFFKS